MNSTNEFIIQGKDMFCINCGAQMPDGAGFCPTCGAKQEGAYVGSVNNASSISGLEDKVKSMNRNRLIGIGTVAVVAIVLIILLVAIFGGRGPEATAKKYTILRFKGEYIAANNLYPSKYVDYMIEEYYDDDKSEYKEGLKESEEKTKEDNKEYDFKLDYVKTEIEDNLTKSEIEEIEEYYEDEYGIELNIKDAKEISVKIKYEYDGETEKHDFTEVVIKVGTKWYRAPYYYIDDYEY